MCVSDGRPIWNDTVAKSLIGKTVLVGLTFESPGSAEHHQFYGKVTSAEERGGILVEMLGDRAGETYNLPPHLDAFRAAASGQYRLRSTGEVIEDPDYTAVWVITRPS